MNLMKLLRLFSTEEKAKQWLMKELWNNQIQCPKCQSCNIQHDAKHSSMPYRCRDCPNKTKFSIKTGSVMEGSKLSYQTWAVAIYLVTNNTKGISSVRLAKELGITQKSAWFLLQRIRLGFEIKKEKLKGTMEVDETYLGGKRKNMSLKKRKELRQLGRGVAGKIPIIGMKCRETNQIMACSVEHTDRETPHQFITENTTEDSLIYTDEARCYWGLPREHQTVNHSQCEYVRDDVHTNGIESHWALFKRGYHGTFHWISRKHLNRYVQEFTTRHNIKDWSSMDQMAYIASNMVNKRLLYRDLVA